MRKLRLSSFLLGGVMVIAAICGGACGSGAGGGQEQGGGGDGGGNDATLSNGEGGINFGPDGGGSSSGSSGSSSGASSGGSGGSNPCVAPSQLTIAPAAQVSSVTVGTPFSQAFTASATYGSGSPTDVTAQTFFSVGATTVGTVTGSTFNWGGVSGGVLTVTGQTCGVTASTTLTLDLSVVFGAGGEDGGFGDAGGEPGAFGDAGVTSNVSCNPTLLYPPDGVLLPPNTNVIEIQFLPGGSWLPDGGPATDGGPPVNDEFEISFENAATNVHIFTTCTPLNGGCVFDLSQAEWDYIAQTNAGGDPVTVQVRGLGCDGSNAGASNTRNILFAEQPLAGTIYYWASINTIASTATYSGGVFRYDFGVRGQTADPVLTPTVGGGGSCIGCHDISLDGRLMIFDYDDNDADDEYTDVNTDVFDVAAETFVDGQTFGHLSKGNAFEPGFHTWNRSHSKFLLSDGAHCTGGGGGEMSCKNVAVAPNGSFTVLQADGGYVGNTPPATPAPAIRGTTPNMAPDDSNVVFAAPPNDGGLLLADGGTVAGFMPLQCTNDPEQDLWFAGASLYVAPWTPTTSSLGTETRIIASNGTDNYYYPSYSPDGTILAFNHAASGPNFHNPLARVQLVPAGVASPVPDDLAHLNDDPTNGGQVTNSWARWAPFIQSYKGGQILWLTMSSTRDYGLRIENDGLENCYPTEGPGNVGSTCGGPPPPGSSPPLYGRAINQNNLTPGCTRAQLWMAAIKLDANGVATGQDVSFPPFWLPFQDLATNNHLGQWAQQAFSGTCTAAAADAGAAPDAGGCAAGLCCFSGGCAPCLTPPPPPPPPPATCAIDANCATGTCCNGGSCGACPDAGGSSSSSSSSGGSSSGGAPCNTCLDCTGQACNGGQCGSCTESTQCCAPSTCVGGQCILPPQ